MHVYSSAHSLYSFNSLYPAQLISSSVRASTILLLLFLDIINLNSRLTKTQKTNIPKPTFGDEGEIPTTMSTSQPPTISSIPALHAFDSHATTWQSYRDRISFYFQANVFTLMKVEKHFFFGRLVTQHIIYLNSRLTKTQKTNIPKPTSRRMVLV